MQWVGLTADTDDGRYSELHDSSVETVQVLDFDFF